MTVPTNSEHLAAAARAFGHLHENILTTYALIRRGDLVAAETYAEKATEGANTVTARLIASGVPVYAFDTDAPDALPARGEVLRLDELAQLDSPEVRTLLECVAALVPLAEKIDQARGRWYPDAPPTDTRGTDLAESLHQVACRLRLEVEGPRGKE